MNQTFNFDRFALLFKKHAVDNYKMYLISTAVLAGILLLFMGITAHNDDGYLPKNAQAAFFIVFLLISGSIFTSMVFADMGEKKKAIQALTLPASHFEKYLVAWLYSFVIFQLVFVAVFYLIAFIVVQFGPNSIPGHDNSVLNLSSTDTNPPTYYAFIFYTFIHAVTFLGAIYFEKLHFIKTAFALFICTILLGIINKPIMVSMINMKITGGTIFSPMDITDGKNSWIIHQASLQNNMGAIALALVVLILWISAYYRLKEKEV